jgi:uncharacterized surface protein with fasciclin (FAS1) repeats
MKKFITFSIIAGIALAFTAFTSANSSTENSSIKNEVLNGDKTIVAIAAGNENFTTLVAAVKAAELIETLNSKGPFTVFAPVNDAFAKLPEGTVASLLKPENKETLSSILTYHVVSGKFMAADVVKAINANNGEFKITTVQGGVLTASLNGANVILTDTKGNKSTVVIDDVDDSNGVIHAIDTVVMP